MQCDIKLKKVYNEIISDLSINRFLSRDNYLVIDFETTSLEKGDPRNPYNRLVSCSIDVYRNGEVTKYYLKEGEVVPEVVADACYSVDYCVAHNSKFEIGWLRRMGLDIDKIYFFCTMIGEYVLAGNRKWNLSLDGISEKRFQKKKTSLVSVLIKSGVCPSEIPIPLLEKYCKQDTSLTNEIFLAQWEELRDSNLLNVMWTRCIATPALVDIEAVGMHLDAERVLAENKKYEREYDEIAKELSEFAGGVNFNSPLQVAELLYDRLGFSELKDRRGNTLRTAKDGRKTDITTITTLKANNKSQRRFLDLYARWSKVDAALTKNLRFFRAVVTETEDCIFYGNLNQTVTQTHRLSSTGKPVEFRLFDGKKKGIQLQNSPREFKVLYNSRYDGWKIGEIDAAQLEFRVAAFLGQDERAIYDILHGVDVHAETASVLTNAGEPTTRQDAKSRTFKPLYGGLSGTKAERAYFSHFREKYSGITDEQERWKDEVLKTGQLVTITGLIFYWPGTKVSRSGYVDNTTSICNFPVQSFATADIIPIAVTIKWRLIKALGLESFIINTIHDSVIEEIHPDEVEIISEIGELSFNSGVKGYLKTIYNIDFNVPLAVEIKIGDHWNE